MSTALLHTLTMEAYLTHHQVCQAVKMPVTVHVWSQTSGVIPQAIVSVPVKLVLHVTVVIKALYTSILFHAWQACDTYDIVVSIEGQC